MLSKMFSPKAKALPAPTVPHARLAFQLRQVKWHLDPNPPANVILIHDLLGSSESWTSVNNAVTALPAKGLSPSCGMNLFSLELRNHGQSPKCRDSGLWDHVQDVLHFSSSLDAAPSGNHLVGHGALGGNIAMLSALVDPSRFKTLTVINGGTAPRPLPLERLSVLGRSLSGEGGGISRTTLVDYERRLAEGVFPSELDRLAMLQQVREVRRRGQGDADQTTLEWVCGFADIERTAAEALQWPRQVVQTESPHYVQPVLFVDAKQRRLTAEEKDLFPNARSVGVDGDWTGLAIRREDGPQLVSELLTFMELMSDLQSLQAAGAHP